MKRLGQCSFMRQISKTDDSIQACYLRIDKLEKQLRERDIPPDQERNIRTELKEIKKLLNANNEQLKRLHSQNRRSFIFAAAFCLICFLVYMIYILVGGKDF